MSPERIILTGVGDVNVRFENISDKPESIMAFVAPLLRTDISFFNEEAIYSPRGIPPLLGDHVPRVNSPNNVAAITFAGFNIGSMANNHTMDLGWEYVDDTIQCLKKEGVQTFGVGRNLAEARKPVVVERKGTTVAFLTYNMIGPLEHYAGPANPGCSYVRIKDLYERIEHQPGTPVWVYTYADRDDLEALRHDVIQAKAKADLVVLSFHWGIHWVEHLLAMYQEEVGHAAIDAGADLILGHHPHVIKGIEVYKGKAIFYSLGNFAVNHPYRRHSAEDSYSRWPGISHYQLLDVLYDHKTDPEYPLYAFPPKSRPALIARCVIEGKKIEKVSFYPCLINGQGQPVPLKQRDPKGKQFIEYVESISKSQGRSLRLSWEGDEIMVAAGDKPSTPIGPNLLRFPNVQPSCEGWA